MIFSLRNALERDLRPLPASRATPEQMMIDTIRRETDERTMPQSYERRLAG